MLRNYVLMKILINYVKFTLNTLSNTFNYIFLPPFLFPPRGKWSPSPLGEGWEGGNKYTYLTLDLFLITDNHIILDRKGQAVIIY